jgi:predicted nucleotidyltransferase
MAGAGWFLDFRFGFSYWCADDPNIELGQMHLEFVGLFEASFARFEQIGECHLTKILRTRKEDIFFMRCLLLYCMSHDQSHLYSSVPTLQPKIEIQMRQIQSALLTLSVVNLVGIILYGSVARGHATYRSDVDLLVIIRQDTLTYSDVQLVRDLIEAHFNQLGLSEILEAPLPVQLTVVRDSVFNSTEPDLQEALLSGIIFLDNMGVLQKNRSAHKLAGEL